jgi:hypothetical protein
MNDEERYLFDLTGYLVVDNVLDNAELHELNALVDSYDVWEERGQSRVGSGQLGLSRQENKVSVDPLHHWDEPFRRLITHPKVVTYLHDLMGPQFRYDHGYAIFMKQGGAPLRLHGGGTPYDPGMYYHCYNGQMYNGLMVVSYALTDVGPGAGGARSMAATGAPASRVDGHLHRGIDPRHLAVDGQHGAPCPSLQI